jgi:hypothetical protein
MHKWGKGGTDPTLRDLAGPGDLDCGSGGIPMSLGEAGPPPKKARTKNCLPPFAQYMCGGCCMFICVTHQP